MCVCVYYSVFFFYSLSWPVIRTHPGMFLWYLQLYTSWWTVFALLLCVCLNNTHRLSFQSNNPSLFRREGDVIDRRRFIWVPGAEVMASHAPVWLLSRLLYAVCVNGLPWHVESCFSSAVKDDRCLVCLILHFWFQARFCNCTFRLSSGIMV